MAVNQDAPAPSRIRDRLGLPDLTGRYQLAGALFVDSLGDGLFLPFAVVYFLKTTGLTLSTVGLGLTVANLLAMVAVPVSGVLIDRLTPAAVVIAGNLISGVGFAGYLLVGNLWELVFFSFFAAVGGRLFWTANLALVGDAFQGSERTRWFAFQRAARNGGYGLGGLFAAAALGTGSGIGYRALALANAVTFLLAALLVWRSRVSLGGGSARKSEVVNGSRRGYRAALTDGPFLLLTAMNVLFVLCMMVLDVLLALYLVRVLHQPVWLSGLPVALNTVAVAGFLVIAGLGAVPAPSSGPGAPAQRRRLGAVVPDDVADRPPSWRGGHRRGLPCGHRLHRGRTDPGTGLQRAGGRRRAGTVPRPLHGRVPAVLGAGPGGGARAVRLAVHREPVPALDRPSRRMRGVRTDPRDQGRPGDRRSLSGG